MNPMSALPNLCLINWQHMVEVRSW